MIDLATIKRLEELVLNSSAPRTQMLQGGWLVRLSRDDVKRARSVTALGDGGGELDARISHCEELYARQGLPPLFRLSPISQPPGLDEALAVRGYTILEPTSVQTTPIGPELPQAEGKWEVVALDLERWAEDVARLRGSTAAERERHLERMRNHGLPTHQVGEMGRRLQHRRRLDPDISRLLCACIPVCSLAVDPRLTPRRRRDAWVSRRF